MSDQTLPSEPNDARFAAVLNASLDAIVVMDDQGCFLEFNNAAETIFGYRRADVIGRPVADYIIPERLRDDHRRGMARYLATGSGPVVNQHVELPALRSDGTEFPVEIAIVPVADALRPIFVSFIRDITRRKEAEQRYELVLGESAHRTRNILGVVQAIISTTLKGERSIEQARDILTSRVAALARSQQNLSGRDATTLLGQLVAEEIEGFSGRVTTSGPDVVLSAASAQTFALILHELATNATKHGALSRPDGHVQMTWNIDLAGAAPLLRFEWREIGGPRVELPHSSGFGLAALSQMATLSFGATPNIDFAPDGFVYRIEANAEQLASRSL